MDRDPADDNWVQIPLELASRHFVRSDCAPVSAYASCAPRSAPSYLPQPVAFQESSSAIWRV